MRKRPAHRLPVAVMAAGAAAAIGIALAPAATADCNSTGNSTLCATGGDVRGGSSYSPPSAPYSPYPCYNYGDPMCLYYDNYDPGIIFDPPNWGIGGPGRPGGGGGRPGGGGGIGPR